MFTKGLQPASAKQVNAFGLYCISGNVWEWVEDTQHDNYKVTPMNGCAWMNSSMRVFRSGSWRYDPKSSRAAARSKYCSDYRYFSYRFPFGGDIRLNQMIAQAYLG